MSRATASRSPAAFLSLNGIIRKPRKMENNQTPSECKHCNADGIHCDKHNEPAGENMRVYPCYIKEFPCPDYEPKEKNDNDSSTTENN